MHVGNLESSFLFFQCRRTFTRGPGEGREAELKDLFQPTPRKRIRTGNKMEILVPQLEQFSVGNDLISNCPFN